MSIYAKNTMVSVEKSRAEIESILSRYGATAFAYATQQDKAMIQFHADDRRIMFVLNLPDRKDRRFTHTRGGKGSSEWKDERAYQLWEQACRQIWRSLALIIKAKLEAIERGITTFEDEFMARIVMPGGKTLAEHMKPVIENSYKTGKFQPLALDFKQP